MKRILPLALVLVACAPMSTATMASAPPKPADCTLAVIDTPATIDRWQMLGTIGLGRFGDADPFAAENIAKIKPKACAMGGDAVSISKSVGHGGIAATSLAYVVWRDKTKPSEVDPDVPREI